MDEHFVQGIVGGVLNRHKDRVLDKKRIQTLMVEIAANIDVAYQLCIPDFDGKPEKWSKFPFIQENVLLCMQLGYDSKKKDNDREIKPQIDDVVKWI